MSARDTFDNKTTLAMSSMEYCGCLFDERDIREDWAMAVPQGDDMVML